MEDPTNLYKPVATAASPTVSFADLFQDVPDRASSPSPATKEEAPRVPAANQSSDDADFGADFIPFPPFEAEVSTATSSSQQPDHLKENTIPLSPPPRSVLRRSQRPQHLRLPHEFGKHDPAQIMCVIG